MWQETAETAEEIIQTVEQENTNIDLLGDIKIRKTRFQDRQVLEVVPSTYEQILELQETGLINIILNSRNRFFISKDESVASQTLSQVLKLYPPLSSLKTQNKAVFEQNTHILDTLDDSAVSLPEWLIEPVPSEIERITI